MTIRLVHTAYIANNRYYFWRESTFAEIHTKSNVVLHYEKYIDKIRNKK